MKQILALVVALVAVAGCSSSYDYYKSGVRYIQDGKDCVYYADEYAQRYSDSIRGFDGKNRIVYRNTRCEDLYARDHGGQTERNDRKVLTPVVVDKPGCTKCTSGCDAEIVPVTRRYYTISAK